MDAFLAKVAEVLEVPEVTADFDFRTVRYWGSLMGFALIVMIEDDYGKTMTQEEFLSAKTVADLAKFVGVAP